MNICIEYFPKFGNNKNVAEYLGEKFQEKGHSAAAYSVADVKPNTLPSSDLYVFCSPTTAGNAAGKMKKFVKKASFEKTDVSYVVSATFMDENTKTVDTLSTLLEDKGIKKASPGVKIKVEGLKGPLEEGYEQKLDSFVQELTP